MLVNRATVYLQASGTSCCCCVKAQAQRAAVREPQPKNTDSLEPEGDDFEIAFSDDESERQVCLLLPPLLGENTSLAITCCIKYTLDNASGSRVLPMNLRNNHS